jgi:hypothetical protein
VKWRLGSTAARRPAEQVITTHELWFHELLGAYAVRLQEGRVTGVHGPIPLSTVAYCDPRSLEYDERPETILRAHDSPEQFCLLEHWHKGLWITPGRPRTVLGRLLQRVRSG